MQLGVVVFCHPSNGLRPDNSGHFHEGPNVDSASTKMRADDFDVR
jgi:hypothetical protein